ncbi:MAG TPA: hypothetical protein VM056_05515 [Terriglobales bacterium]|nr:hypothetical protein [Terriglobales bacterium]
MPEVPDDLRFYLGLASLGTIAALSFLVAFIAARGIKERWKDSPKDDARFSDREPLTLDAFYEVFYSGEKLPRTVVLETVSRFAAAAHAPAQFLKPDDTFATIGAKNLGECEKFITDTAVLLQEAEKRFGVKLFSGNLTTLDDYIRVHVLAARLVSRSAVSGNK